MSLPETDNSAFAAPRRSPTSEVGRVARLAVKELRETLRDRRTVITLLLMPLLIYPLISIAFQRFLLSNVGTSAGVVYRIGFESHDDGTMLIRQLRHGTALLEGRDSEETTNGDVEQPAGSLQEDWGGGSGVQLQFFWNSALEEDVSDYAIDLGIRLRNAGEIRTVGIADSVIDAELVYLEGSLVGRDAAEYVERRFRAVNERTLERRLRDLGVRGRLTPISAARRPLRSSDDRGAPLYSLAALVPLILILMTITGAVYPAIDLTAGERERGTLEVLIAAPVPRVQLLLAKYIAVLTVTLLTATVNLATMTVVILSIGLGSLLFGDAGISLQVIVQVLGLLILFAAFFAAVLLALTSFARSFKEAQAYLIPLILVSIAPGMLSIMPGIELKGILAVTPLANIVLLSRDLFEGTADPAIILVVTFSTALFAMAAIATAARIFGTDAILYGSHGSWSDMFRRPEHESRTPTVTSAMLCLALLFPAYFLLGNMLARLQGASLELLLGLMSLITILLFGELPLAAAVLNRVRLSDGFRIKRTSLIYFAAAAILGLSLWPFVHEIVVLQDWVGLATVESEQFQRVESLLSQWKTISPMWILITLALVPAIFEEFFFRGYLLSALCSRTSELNAVLLCGLLFGLFHLLVTDQLVVVRFIPSTLLGIALGWVCVRSGSVLPGMLLHACHNGFLVLLSYYRDHYRESFDRWLFGSEWQRVPGDVGAEASYHLPVWLLLSAAVLVAMGYAMITRGVRKDDSQRFTVDAPSVIR